MTDTVAVDNIGIFGGTFDPVHNGHLMVAELAMEAAKLGRVLFVPAGTPPHKGGRALTHAEHRLQMVRLAVAGTPGFAVSDVEIATPGVDYTVDTLRHMKRADPGARLHFIIGGDSLMYLDQWRDPEGLMALASFVAVYRPDHSLAELKRKREQILMQYGGEILLVACPGMDVSSTEIRRMAAAGQDISALVPPGVAAYIEEHGLYRESV